jgi:hypothetical protein
VRAGVKEDSDKTHTMTAAAVGTKGYSKSVVATVLPIVVAVVTSVCNLTVACGVAQCRRSTSCRATSRT